MKHDWQQIPDTPATFEMTVRLAMTTVRPFRDPAMQLQPGDQLRLLPQRGHPCDPAAVAVCQRQGTHVGYLYAEQAAWMSLMLKALPACRDHSFVRHIQREPAFNQIQTTRKRYPIVMAGVVLEMPTVRPLYTIAAMIGFRRDDFETFFHLADNLYLKPLMEGYRICRSCDYDSFRMPEAFIRSWLEIAGSR